MYSLGAVRGQDTAVLAHATRDRQPCLVPHGFGESQLDWETKEKTQKEGNTNREIK